MIERVVIKDFAISLESLDAAGDIATEIFLAKKAPEKDTLLCSFEIALTNGFDHLPEDVYLLIQEQFELLKLGVPLSTKHSNEGVLVLQALQRIANELNVAYANDVGHARALHLSQLIPRVLYAGLDKITFRDLNTPVGNIDYNDPKVFEEFVTELQDKYKGELEDFLLDVQHLMSDEIITRLKSIKNYVELMELDPNRMIELSPEIVHPTLKNFNNFLQQVIDKLLLTYGMHSTTVEALHRYIQKLDMVVRFHLKKTTPNTSQTTLGTKDS